MELVDVELVDVELVDVESVDVELVDVELVDVELVDVELVDRIKSATDEDVMSINETCSSSIGTPPSFGQSV